MKAALVESYRNASYAAVLPTGPVHLAVDRQCPRLMEWLRASGHHCAAWLTAYNPLGEQRADSLNIAAQRDLEQQLAGSGYTVMHGTALDPAGSWPPEPSLLVPGLPLDEAKRLASEYRQLAILWCGEDAIPRLVETDQVAR